MQPFLHLSWDSATYVKLANSIIYHGSYDYDNIPHIKYPPGFPAILAPIAYYLDGEYIYFRALIALFATINLYFLNILFQKTDYTSPPSNHFIRAVFPTLACLLLISDVRYCISSSYVLADVPFAAALTMTAYITVPIIEGSIMSRGRIFVSLVAVIFLSTLRIVGVAMGGALFLWILTFWKSSHQRTKNYVFLLIIANVSVVVLWLLRSAILAPSFLYDSLDHVGYLPELFTSGIGTVSAKQVSLYEAIVRVQKNLHFIINQLFITLSNQNLNSWYGPSFVTILSIFLLLGAAPGCCVSWFLAFIILVYGSIVALWEAEQGLRFSVPMAPLIYLYITKGFKQLYTRSNQSFRAVLCLLMVLILIVRFKKVGDFIKYEQSRPYPRTQEEQQWLDVSQWLIKNLSDNQKFLAEDAPVLAHLSSRKGFAAPPDPSKLDSYIRALKVEYILNRENMPWTNTIEKFADINRYPEVAQTSGYRIYHIIQPDLINASQNVTARP